MLNAAPPTAPVAAPAATPAVAVPTVAPAAVPAAVPALASAAAAATTTAALTVAPIVAPGTAPTAAPPTASVAPPAAAPAVAFAAGPTAGPAAAPTATPTIAPAPATAHTPTEVEVAAAIAVSTAVPTSSISTAAFVGGTTPSAAPAATAAPGAPTTASPMVTPVAASAPAAAPTTRPILSDIRRWLLSAEASSPPPRLSVKSAGGATESRRETTRSAPYSPRRRARVGARESPKKANATRRAGIDEEMTSEMEDIISAEVDALLDEALQATRPSMSEIHSAAPMGTYVDEPGLSGNDGEEHGRDTVMDLLSPEVVEKVGVRSNDTPNELDSRCGSDAIRQEVEVQEKTPNTPRLGPTPSNKRNLSTIVAFPQDAQSSYIDSQSRRLVSVAPSSPKRVRAPISEDNEGKQEGSDSDSIDALADLYESDFEPSSPSENEPSEGGSVEEDWPVSSTISLEAHAGPEARSSETAPGGEQVTGTSSSRRQSAITELYERQPGPVPVPASPVSGPRLWQVEFSCPQYDQWISSHGALTDADKWLKALGGRRILAPEPGSSLWYCIHGVRTRHCSGETMRKRPTTNHEASYFKTTGLEWMDMLLEVLVRTGAVDVFELHKACFRYHMDAPSSVEDAIMEVRAFLAVTRSIPITDALAEERWPSYATVMAIAWWLREPIFLITPSGQVLMFHLERYEGDASHVTESVKMHRLEGNEAHRTITTLLTCRFLPTILISSSETTVGVVTAFRLHEWMYPEWSKPDSNGWPPKRRLNFALQMLGLYPPPKEVSYTLPKATPAARRHHLDDFHAGLFGQSVCRVDSVVMNIDEYLISESERAALRADLNPYGRTQSIRADEWRKAEAANAIMLDRLNYMPWKVTIRTPCEHVTATLENIRDCTEAVQCLAALPYPEVAIATIPGRLTRRIGNELIGLGQAASLKRWAESLKSKERAKAVLEWIADTAGPAGLGSRWKETKAVPLVRSSDLPSPTEGHKRVALEKDEPWLRAVLAMVVLDTDYNANLIALRSYEAQELLTQHPENAREFVGQLRDHVWVRADQLRLGGGLNRPTGPPSSSEGEAGR